MASKMQGGMFGGKKGLAVPATPSAQDEITRLYRAQLGRDPDQAGLDWWTQQANSGAVTLDAIRQNFQTVRAEGTDPLRGSPPPANMTYGEARNQAALMDNLDAAGKENWARSHMGSPVAPPPPPPVAYAPPPPPSAAQATPQNPLMNLPANDPALLERARSLSLGSVAPNRVPTAAETAAYMGAMNDLIYGTKQTGVTPGIGEALTSVYQNTLGRLPDAAGAEYWTKAFDDGMTLQQIEASIRSDKESQGRQAVYSDNPLFTGNEWTPAALAGRGLAQQGLANIAGGSTYDPNAPLSATNVLQTADDWSGYNSRLGTPNQQPVNNQSYGGGSSGGQVRGSASAQQQQQEPFQQPDPVRPVRYDLDFTGLGDPNIERQRVEDAIFARMNPQLDRARAALETRLANQGITQGSEAYRTAIDENDRAANDARIAAILSGGQEQSRLFGLGLNQAQFQNQGQNQEFSQGLANAQLNNATSAQAFNQALAEAQFQNQANQAAINQALMERQIPLNEIIALMSGSQVQQPSFVNTTQTPLQGTDITGNIYANYQGAMNRYNQQVAQQNAMMGGLFGAAGTLGGAYLLSDRRLKKNIVKLGQIWRGVFLYAYDYIWGGPRQIGVMADEVKRIMPEAVTRIGNYDAVDYGMVFRRP